MGKQAASHGYVAEHEHEGRRKYGRESKADPDDRVDVPPTESQIDQQIAEYENKESDRHRVKPAHQRARRWIKHAVTIRPGLMSDRRRFGHWECPEPAHHPSP